MRWEEFLKVAGNSSVVETEALLVGVTDPKPLKVQISRWQRAGKLIQLKRGIYLLSRTYRKQEVNGFYLACLLKKPSYVSLEKALEYYGLIPEAVRVYTAVTTKRPAEFASQAGRFNYRHLKQSLFWGYRSYRIGKQTVFIAQPEKALLDLVYLNKIKISPGYIEELRLQNTESINLKRLMEFSRRFNKPMILRAARSIKEYINSEKGKEKSL